MSDRDVVRALDAGVRTLSGLCRTTGAGQNCGTCVFSVKRLLCEHEGSVVPTLAEVDVAAS